MGCTAAPIIPCFTPRTMNHPTISSWARACKLLSTWKRSNCSLALPQLHPLHTALVSLVLKTHISGRNKSKVFNKLESAFVYVGVCVCAHQQPKSTKENGPCSAQHMGVAPLLQALNALDALLDRATEIHEPMANDSQCNKIKLCSQVAIMRPYDCPLTQGGAGDMQEATTLWGICYSSCLYGSNNLQHVYPWHRSHCR